MAYESFYEGTPSSLDPSYGDLFVGYRVPSGELGAPTSIQTANQVQEVSNLLNQGIKFIEIQPLQEGVFDQIPKQHFKEIARIQKLAGAETSIHAPILEPSGIGREGWSESDRAAVERELKMVVDKSHELSPQGNIPITIHASAIHGTEYSPPSKEMVEDYKKQIREYRGRDPTPEELKNLNEQMIVAINQETYQMIPARREVKFYPERGKTIIEARDEVKTINNSEWVNSITNLALNEKYANETIGNAYNELAPLILKAHQGEKIPEEERAGKGPAFAAMERGEIFIENVAAAFRTLYSKAYKNSDEGTKEYLNKHVAEFWKDGLEKIDKKMRLYGKPTTETLGLQRADAIQAKATLVNQTINNLKQIGEGRIKRSSGEIVRLNPPETFKPIEDFATEKSAQTFANVALYGYEKYGDNAPIVSVENLFPGMAFSRSEQLKKLINDSRENFIIEAVKKGHSKSEAENAAEKLIGATWDVGHINIMRKEGYKTEDIIRETEKIAPYVKHVHLTDNFGHSDSHLSPGMGNVPTKEILEKLEKAGFEGKKIIEAGGFVQHFKVSPTQAVLEALGSPLYPMKAEPYWNQIRNTYGGYFSGYGPILPESHFSMYGAGFSGMPVELGGQMPGKQSRFAGAPTE